MTPAAAALGAVVAVAAVPRPSPAEPSLGRLQSQLHAEQARQHTLSAGIANLSHVIGSLGAQIRLVESREAVVRAELATDRAKLARIHLALVREQRLVALLRERLARARLLLEHQLISGYEQAKPDLVSVVLESSGFRDLLNRLSYLHDAQQQQQTIISYTKTSKAQADAAAARLASLQAPVQRITLATGQRVAALAGMNMLLHAKQEALRKARAAKRDALGSSRARGGALQARISKIVAEQAAQGPRPVGPTYGPSGGWAIPYAIVLCESGGQDLTPNSAGASGYYQIMPATWRLYGGTGPAAYLAPKSEQDAVAGRIWNGGAGASNWDCASIVGIH